MWENILLPIIKRNKSKCIVEIGSDKGINTKNILDYCIDYNANLISIDPYPKYNVGKYSNDYGNIFTFFEGLSLDYLPDLNDYDCILIDGDHNWYTVFNELKIIDKNFNQDDFPVVFLHDISWPYGRRDLYYNPENIPPDYLNDYSKLGIDLFSNELSNNSGVNANLFNANEENTPKNGVLTAIEDFLKYSKLKLDFHKFPFLNGLGIIHKRDNDFYEYIEDLIHGDNVLNFICKNYVEEKFIRDEKLSILNKKLLDYIDDNNELNHINSINNKRINSLVSENKHLTNETVSLNNKIDTLNSENKSLSDKTIALDSKIDTLNSENKILLEENLHKSKEIENILSENLNFVKEIFEKSIEIDNLQKKADYISDELKSNDKLVYDVTGELYNCKLELTNLSEKLSSCLLECDSLKKRNSALTKTKNRQLEEIIELKSHNDGLKELADQLTLKLNENNLKISENEHLKNNFKNISKELDSCLITCDSLKKRNLALTKTKNRQLEEIVELKSDNDALNEIICNLNNNNVDLKSIIDEIDNDFDILIKKYQNTVYKNYNLMQENYYLNKSNMMLKIQKKDFLNSNSWKLTSIFRKFSNLFKSKNKGERYE